MLQVWKYGRGDVIEVFCCNSCMYKNNLIPKSPADSGVGSWLCEVCGHCNTGSIEKCVIGEWLKLTPIAVYGDYQKD